MEFGWSEQQLAFRRKLLDFLDETLPPDWSDIARDGPGSHAQMDYAREFCPKMAQAGLLTRHWPVEYGGEAGATPWEHMILSEEMWSIGDPRSSGYMGANWIAPTIMKYGTPEQKAFHLGKIASGEVLWAQGFSEPSAGSDLASLRTQATRVQGGYVINGSKIWTSYAHSADYVYLLTRTEGAAHAGITIFLVDLKLPGIDIRPINSILGEGEFHEVFFTDVFVPDEARLGEEGRGWAIVRAALHSERIGAARHEMARRTILKAVAELRRRKRFSDPVVRMRAATALALARAARLLVYAVVEGRVKARDPSAETSIARYALYEADKAAAAFVAEFLPESLLDGGDGQLRAAFASGATVGLAAGSAEVQLNLIARDGLSLPMKA
ncbi:MAG: acyl-CoA dehydrogenase family protein [Caulobacteraceae bacterium]|nr:acyl-CoA dehydrogenase family protein [Caulobacteraceae bacterium]